MSTILIIILIIAGISIFSFIKSSVADTDRIVKEGGIYNKYKTLIDNFIDDESGMKVIEQTNKYMCVGMKNSSGSIAFHFQHTFDTLNVTFKMKNIFIGDHKLEWEFPETMPQSEMIKHIETRMSQYMDNVKTRFE